MRIRVRLPAQQPQLSPTPEPILTTPATYLTYDEAVRLTISTPGLVSGEFRSGKYGWLVGTTVFASAIDSGDTYSITLRGRALKSNIFPVASLSQEEDFNEPLDAGDRVTILYNSLGSTSKNIDFTPRIKYDPRSNP